jgi:hypothetical protein
MKTLLLKILLLGSVVLNLCLVLQLRESKYETEQMTKANRDANDTSDFLMGQHKAVTSNLQFQIHTLTNGQPNRTN